MTTEDCEKLIRFDEIQPPNTLKYKEKTLRKGDMYGKKGIGLRKSQKRKIKKQVSEAYRWILEEGCSREVKI